MNYELFASGALKTALSLLPGWMDTQEARAQVLACLLQESRLTYRKQEGGPARGYPQFEIGGIKAVLNNSKTGPLARLVMARLDYPNAVGEGTAQAAYVAIEHNDVLGAVFSRLLLSADPEALPKRGEAMEGWKQYLRTWRPGKPRPETWEACFTRAWSVVDNMGVPA